MTSMTPVRCCAVQASCINEQSASTSSALPQRALKHAVARRSRSCSACARHLLSTQVRRRATAGGVHTRHANLRLRPREDHGGRAERVGVGLDAVDEQVDLEHALEYCAEQDEQRVEGNYEPNPDEADHALALGQVLRREDQHHRLEEHHGKQPEAEARLVDRANRGEPVFHRRAQHLPRPASVRHPRPFFGQRLARTHLPAGALEVHE
jgi:hypothetical protein